MTISGTATDAAARWPASRSRPTTGRPGIRPPGRRPGPTAGSPTARRARPSRRARSTTAATSSRPPRASTVNVGCPCTMAGRTDARRSLDQQDSNAVELGMRFKADLDGSITGVRFYKSAANTGTHVGSLWTTSGTLLATGTFSGESASGWQQMTFTDAGRHHRGHDLRRVLLRAARALLVLAGLLLPARARAGRTRSTARRCTRSARTAASPTASTPTRARARSRPRRSTGRTTASTSASCRSCRRARPAPHGDGRARLGHGQLLRAGHRRAADPLHRHAVHRLDGAGADDRHGQPAGDVGRRSAASIPATSYTFKVQAANGSGTSPFSAASNAVTPTAADRARRADRGHRQRRQPPGDGPLDGAERRRRHDHALHDHAVPRRRRAGHDAGDRIAGADDRRRDGPRPTARRTRSP